MADYKSQYNKFDIVRELLAQRYMITTLMVNINNLCYYLEGREKTLRELLPEDKRKKIQKSIRYLNEIEFDKFKLSAQYFNAMVSKYGSEAVGNACIIVDNYIKDNPDKQLSQSQINKRIKEYTIRCYGVMETKDYLAEAIKKSNQLDYKMIDNEAVARQYIASIPYYMRSINEGCKYLRERFNL